MAGNKILVFHSLSVNMKRFFGVNPKTTDVELARGKAKINLYTMKKHGKLV